MCNDHSLNFSLLFIPLWVWTLAVRSLGFLTARSLHGSLSPRWPSIQTANWPLGVPVICSRTFCYIRPNHSGWKRVFAHCFIRFFLSLYLEAGREFLRANEKHAGGNRRHRLWLVLPHKHTTGCFDERLEKQTWFSGLLAFLVRKAQWTQASC